MRAILLAARPGARRQRGFALLELAIAAMLLTLGAVWMASRLNNDLEDAGARATGRYLLAIKGAVQELMVEHFDLLSGYPPSTGSPGGTAAPAWLAQALPLELSVAQLKQARAPGAAAYLPGDFPPAPVYGGEVRVRLWREGLCPGPACKLQAIVHTAAPVRGDASVSFSPELVGLIMLATDGYGGHAPAGAAHRLRGAIFDVPNPMGDIAGIVAVSASLDTTLFHQFVRQGDTRPVWLRNDLHVSGVVASAGGLALETAVQAGAGCGREGLYAMTAGQSLAMCLSGTWFELTRYVVTGMAADLADGAPLPQPVCQGAMLPFVRVAMQGLDVTMGGAAIDVHGELSGSITGSGSVSEMGEVSVSGSFGGVVASTPDSRIRVLQSADAGSGILRISGAGPQARAYAVYGCHHA